MAAKQRFSDKANSELVMLMMKRAGASRDATPESVIESLATALRRKRRLPGRPVMQLDPFLVARNVVEFNLRADLNCEGYLEAKGHSYAEGFRMVVKRDVCEERMRFTIAHELCHTFFYEFVPELKFREHHKDDQEEALCNFGAASFLMPAEGLRSRAGKMSVSIESLSALAEEYGVSLPTMFLRLRFLRAWKCELSFWRRLCDGTFDIQKLYGGNRIDWRWLDNSVPTSAWELNRAMTGNSFLEWTNNQGSRRLKPVWYQLSRRGDALIGLWGSLAAKAHHGLPLFDGVGRR
jgi:hypothetical protein